MLADKGPNVNANRSCTDTTEAEQKVIECALLRYRDWASTFPDQHERVLKGSDAISGGKLGADMIRACAALAKLK